MKEKIKQKVNRTSINSKFKGLISDLIYAELFYFLHFHQNKITGFDIRENKPDDSIFIVVSIEIYSDDNDIALFPLRPFVDKSSHIIQIRDNILTLQKTYFVYRETEGS